MLTNVKSAVAAHIDGFLLVASSANSASQYHLLIFNRITGKSDSIILGGRPPVNEANLRDEFYTMISSTTLFGFKSFDAYQDVCNEYGMDELSPIEALKEYNDFNEKSRFLLQNIGSIQQIECFMSQNS